MNKMLVAFGVAVAVNFAMLAGLLYGAYCFGVYQGWLR